MQSWTFYSAFIGTSISIVAWTYLALKEHLTHIPRTLSELASEKPQALRYYRIVLWTCGPLFAVTTLGFIVPRVAYTVPVGIACGLTIMAELLVGVFPAQRGRITIHDIIAGVMGLSMIASAYLFAWSLHGFYTNAEMVFTIFMTLLALLCLIDRKRYLFYELPFIFLAHFSVLIAAIALR